MSFNPQLAEILRAHADRPTLATETADLLLLAAEEVEKSRPIWLDPLVNHPPGGDVLMLTWGGICVVAKFSHDQGRAWLPRPDTPAEIKRRKRVLP